MNHLDQAIQVLNSGGIVIFPTDTAFGMGCRVDRPQAIQKLFSIRKRPTTQAISLLVDSEQMAANYWPTPLPYIVRRLMKKYWPGGLTVIYTANIDRTLPLVRGNGTTIGIRMPAHPVTLALIKGVGMSILGPSANFHKKPTPYKFEDLDPDLVKLVDYVIPGECKTKRASTVVDCTQSPYKIIRAGSVNVQL